MINNFLSKFIIDEVVSSSELLIKALSPYGPNASANNSYVQFRSSLFVDFVGVLDRFGFFGGDCDDELKALSRFGDDGFGDVCDVCDVCAVFEITLCCDTCAFNCNEVAVVSVCDKSQIDLLGDPETVE